MKDNTSVSVIITTFNRLVMLKRAVNSVLSQSYKNFDIIIVDDCSSDGTIDYLLKLETETPNIKLVLKKANQGLVDSRNKGILASSGEYICLLDDDDYWINEDKLSIQVKSITSSKEILCSAVSTNDGTILTSELPANWRNQIIYRNGFIHTSTVMIARQGLISIGLYDSHLVRGIDSDLFRRLIIKENYTVNFCNTPLAHYELDSQNRITQKKSLKYVFRYFQQIIHLSFKYGFILKENPKLYFFRLLVNAKELAKMIKGCLFN